MCGPLGTRTPPPPPPQLPHFWPAPICLHLIKQPSIDLQLDKQEDAGKALTARVSFCKAPIQSACGHLYMMADADAVDGWCIASHA